MVQQWWQKLNANERMAATGAIVVFIVSLLGTGWLSLIGSAAVLAIYWLKYSPNQVNWPAPTQLINLVISGIIALFAVLGLLAVIGLGGFGLAMLGAGGGLFGGMYILFVIAAIALAVGAGMMLLGTWREYQAMPKAPAPPAGGPPPPPPAPPAQSPAAPPSEPPTA